MLQADRLKVEEIARQIAREEIAKAYKASVKPQTKAEAPKAEEPKKKKK